MYFVFHACPHSLIWLLQNTSYIFYVCITNLQKRAHSSSLGTIRLMRPTHKFCYPSCFFLWLEFANFTFHHWIIAIFITQVGHRETFQIPRPHYCHASFQVGPTAWTIHKLETQGYSQKCLYISSSSSSKPYLE